MAIRTLAACALATLLGGCVYHGGSADYRGYEVMGEQNVRFGVVEATRDVRIRPMNTGVGSATGGGGSSGRPRRRFRLSSDTGTSLGRTGRAHGMVPRRWCGMGRSRWSGGPAGA